MGELAPKQPPAPADGDTFRPVSATALWGENPIIEDQPLLADPHVLEHNGMFYVYPTSNEANFEVYTRPVKSPGGHWTLHPTPVLVPSLRWCPITLVPGYGKHVLAWAPHVSHDPATGKFYMYYSVCLSIGVAVADSPLGPFEDRGKLLNFAIDAFVFRAGDGHLYMYYAKLAQPTRLVKGVFESIYGVRMDSWTKLGAGSPVEVLRPSQSWEYNNGTDSIFPSWGVVEGPWVSYHDGLYYMTYSGSSAESKDYDLGYAISKQPLGPYVKAGEGRNPFIYKGGGIFGPGHHSIWQNATDGRLWAFYHQKTYAQPGWQRFLCVDEITLKDGVMTLHATRARH